LTIGAETGALGLSAKNIRRNVVVSFKLL